jgi:hypothetical protein
MPERPHDAELTGLEAVLLTLKPAAAGIERDRLMFEAGRRSARRGRLWPCAAVALALVSAALGAALAMRPAPPAVVRVVFVERPAAPPSVPAPGPVERSPAPAAADYFRLQEQLLSRGLDGLPPPPPPAAPPQTLDQLLSGPEYAFPASGSF